MFYILVQFLLTMATGSRPFFTAYERGCQGRELGKTFFKSRDFHTADHVHGCIGEV
jgi:hypothetical protein